MTYFKRVSISMVSDSLIVISAIFFSRFLLGVSLDMPDTSLAISALTLLLSHHVFSVVFRLYQKAWAYASTGELIIVLKCVTYSIAAAAAMQLAVSGDIHIRLLTITWLLHMTMIGGSRFALRIFKDMFAPDANRSAAPKKRTLIIGAGSAGTMIARQLLHSAEAELQPVAFIDDNVKMRDLHIMGIPVVGGIPSLGHVIRELDISNIIIAIPSLSRKSLHAIYQECAKTDAKTQILPMIEDIVSGKVSVSQVRDVQVEDLLGREPVELDIAGISECVTGKVVLVTGAGGSIGSEICRQVAAFKPRTLVLLGHGENSIYAIEMELLDLYGDQEIQIVTEIGELQDADKMMSIMSAHRPDVVYHAAAHKHVPLMERNPEEAVKNNVIGTMNAAKAASKHGVSTFVMISTDKAVNPTSVMGATKRLAEMIIQDLDQSSLTRFVAVRFGNVLGSRGSVIPLFKKQIEKGGPVKVTHPDMIRYFMTIPEASRLVLQAGAMAQGGEVFVLDMGEPVKIVDLARNLILLSGNTVEDIGIEFTGIRPGEKLFEELLNENEVHEQKVYPKIYIGKKAELRIEQIHELLREFESLDKAMLREWLLDLANNRLTATERQLIMLSS
ncbi:polysaccharide biosynthesis protein [Paenibacillus aurantiacus]|uniref:Polysaccharide biosynthesis protein n=1 Tax=Paenibacillus aurantiacus TaxID=1936118 RepID=A0ABV5KIL2_9BACL